MSSRVLSYLRTQRRTWGLTQRELAILLGLTSPTQLSRVERDLRLPSLDVLIAYEVIYRRTPRMLFPRRYEHVEERVMRHAKELLEHLRGDKSRRAGRVRELLTLVLSRPVTRSLHSDP